MASLTTARRRARPAALALLTALLVSWPGGAWAAELGAVKGRLVGPDDAPLVGYVVRLVGETGKSAESRPTNRSGEFELEGIPQGAYRIVILTEDRRACDTSVAPAVVPETGSLEIDLRLVRLPNCKGDVPKGSRSMPKVRNGANGRRGLLWGGIGGGTALALLLGGGGGNNDPPMSEVEP